MALFKKENYKWIITLTFFGLIFLPGKMPIPAVKYSVIGLMGGLSLLFQLFYLNNVAPQTDTPKADKTQTIVLMILTIGVIIAYILL